jgi:hypothetical protein
MLLCLWFVSIMFSVALWFFLRELAKIRKDLSAYVIANTIKTNKEVEFMIEHQKQQELDGSSVNDIFGVKYNA